MKSIKYLVRTFKMLRRAGGVNGVKMLAQNGPKYAQLYRRLLSDNRVPMIAKIVLLGGLVFAISPLNVPQYIPVIGALDDLGIILFVSNFFMKQVPLYVLQEHRQAVGLFTVSDTNF